jgi:hypothetical protein
MTIISREMTTSELVAFLKEADDFSQFSDLTGAVREAVRIAIDRLAADPGWKRVPEEPTPQMLDAFHDRIRILCKPDLKEAEVLNDAEVYRAMLAAAPTN